MKRLLHIQFLISSCVLYGQDIEWYQETWSGLVDIEVSETGIVTVAGTYSHNNSTVNGVTLNTHGIGTYMFDPFVAQYNNQGKLLWVQTGWISGYGFQYVKDAATDSENSAIVTGYFGDELLFCGSTLVPYGSNDMFVAKYSSSGQCLWSRSIGGVGGDYAYYVKTDTSNNIYISGKYTGNLTIDGQTFNGSSSMGNQAIIKLNPYGKLVWMHTTHANSIQHFDVTDSGIVYIAGDSHNYFELDGNHYTITPGEGNQYIIKLTANGQTDWVKYIDSPNSQRSDDIVVDNSGNAYVLCDWFNDVTIDGTPISTTPKSQKILKIDKLGNVDWHSEFLGSTSQCFGGKPMLTRTHHDLPCISCTETEIVDSINYQNYYVFGFTYATLDPANGSIEKKVVHSNLKYFGKPINFDKFGALYSIGGDLQGAQFSGTYITPPTEGTYIYKLEGESPIGEGFLFYPNPSTGVFNIQLETEIETEYLIEFFDINGKLVHLQKNTIDGAEQLSIDGSHWARGVYQGRVSSFYDNYKFKVLIQ